MCVVLFKDGGKVNSKKIVWGWLIFEVEMWC